MLRLECWNRYDKYTKLRHILLDILKMSVCSVPEDDLPMTVASYSFPAMNSDPGISKQGTVVQRRGHIQHYLAWRGRVDAQRHDKCCINGLMAGRRSCNSRLVIRCALRACSDSMVLDKTWNMVGNVSWESVQSDQGCPAVEFWSAMTLLGGG